MIEKEIEDIIRRVFDVKFETKVDAQKRERAIKLLVELFESKLKVTQSNI